MPDPADATGAKEAPQAPAPTTVEGQIAAMEARIAEGKTIVEKEKDDAVRERGPEEVHVGETPGDSPEVGGRGEGGEGEAEEGEGEGGEEEELEGQGEEEVEEEAGEAEEAEEEEEEEEPVFLARLPGRRQGDPDIEIEFAGLTKSEEEALNRLRNGYLRAEDARTQLEEASRIRDEVEAVAAHMDMNPVGYISSVLPEEQKVELVTFLMADEAIFNKVFPEISDWEADANLREGSAAKIERDLLKKANEATQKAESDRRAREHGDMIVNHLEGMAEHLSDTQLNRFMRFALSDLREHVKENPKAPLDLEDVNRVLTQTGVFETFGVEPSLPDSHRSAPKTARDKLATAKAKVADARKTSDRFKKKRARKRSAGTSPPGSGPGPVRPPFKKGETVEERIAYIEKYGIPKT